MKLFDELYGNDKLKSTVARDIVSGKQSHAYIFEGPEGSGKHTAAMLTAAAMFCRNRTEEKFPCGKCNSCSKVFENICTDIITVNKGDKATIGVSAIRDSVKSTLYYAPTEMSCKVYIIEEADKMTVQAQNALLLSLEEPPEFVMFILLCENSLLLLDTVKSRAPVIQTEIFSNDKVKEFIISNARYKKLYSSEQELDNAILSCSGTIGKALALLKKDDAADEKLRAVAADAVSVLCTSSPITRIEALSLFPQKRADVIAVLTHMKEALRDILYCKKTNETELLFYKDPDTPKSLAKKASLRKISETFDRITKAESDINSNVNVNAVLTLLLT